MKSAVLMVLAGTGLFSGTVCGLLAVQGRLDFDGTRGLPLLSMVFRDPSVEHGEAMPADPASHEPEPHPILTAEDDAARLDGLGREVELPREKGPAVTQGAPDPKGLAVSEDEPEAGADAPDAATAQGEGEDTTREFHHVTESLMGQGQYRRGQLFSFQRVASGMSVAEIDEIVGAAKAFEKVLSRREAALDEREADLSVREADIEERERAVLEKMREVLQERGRVEEQIASFQKTFTLVRANESESFKSYAAHLASLPAEKSSQILLQLWQADDGKEKAVKILKMMTSEARDEIFGVLSAEQTQEILDRVTAAVEEKK